MPADGASGVGSTAALGELTARLDRLTGELQGRIAALGKQVASLEEAARRAQETRDIELLRAIKEGLLDPTCLVPPQDRSGARPHYLVCSSVPKSGTHLALELARALGFKDTRFDVTTHGLSVRAPDGTSGILRPMPALLALAALVPGSMCAAHLEYSYVLDAYLAARAGHKMIFMIRDPRDLVISWVDFVYNSPSYPKMSGWNRYTRARGLQSHPDDVARISGSIEGVLGFNLLRFLPWMGSSSCLPVRFEDLYAELQQGAPAGRSPTLDRIAAYLEIASVDREQAASALGRGLTASERTHKVGIHRARMNAAHLQRIARDDFQQLVVSFGYEPT